MDIVNTLSVLTILGVIFFWINKYYYLDELEEERYKLNALNNKELNAEIIRIRGDLANHQLYGKHKVR